MAEITVDQLSELTDHHPGDVVLVGRGDRLYKKDSADVHTDVEALKTQVQAVQSKVATIPDITNKVDTCVTTIGNMQSKLTDNVALTKETNAKTLANEQDIIEADRRLVALESAAGHTSGTVPAAPSNAPTSDNLKQAIADVAVEVGKNTSAIEELKKGGAGGGIELQTLDIKGQPTQYNALAKSIKIYPPLQAWEDPDVEDGAVLELKHDHSAVAASSNYYAALAEEEELTASTLGHNENTVKTTYIWMDDTVVPTGGKISIDRAGKRIGIQEIDGLDPNITGGTTFLISYRVAFKGRSQKNQTIDIFLEGQDGQPLTDDAGKPCIRRKVFTTSKNIGMMTLTCVVKAKGLEYFKLAVRHNGSNPLVVKERDEEGTSIMVQALTKDRKTGEALQQYQLDTGEKILFNSHYFGDGVISPMWAWAADVEPTVIRAKAGQKLDDGWDFDNITPVTVAVKDKHLILNDNGSDMCFFTLGKALSSIRSKALKGRPLSVTVNLKDKNNAFVVQLAKWTGAADEYTQEVITGMQNGQPVMAPNWELVSAGELDIAENVVLGDHTVTGSMAVPNDDDLQNVMLLIRPLDIQYPCTLSLKTLQADTEYPFTKVTVRDNLQDAGEALDYKEYSVRLVEDTEGNAGMRYTVNKGDTKIPVGDVVKGDDTVVRRVGDWTDTGSQGHKEGDIEFLKTGHATIGGVFKGYLGEGAKAGATIHIRYVKVLGDGSYQDITGAHIAKFVAQSEKGKPQTITVPEFGYAAQVGDKLRIVAKTDMDDGFFLQADSKNTYLSDTVINIEVVE